MPEFGYSFQGYDPVLHVLASGREVDVSPKATREVCLAIKGKTLGDAKAFLEAVVDKRRAVAFRRHKKKAAHQRGLPGFHAGAFPTKAARKVLEVLSNLEANADFRGMDTERLHIVHAAAHRGRAVRAFTPRAFGRASPSFGRLVHIELVGREV